MKQIKYLVAMTLLMTACSENKTEEAGTHDSTHIGAAVGPLDVVEALSEADSTDASEEPAKKQEEK